jgi:hypothetical protein
MSETIREYVGRRLRWFYFCWTIGLGLFFVPRLLNESATASQLQKIAGLLLLAVAAIVMASVTCPRCSNRSGSPSCGSVGRPSSVPIVASDWMSGCPRVISWSATTGDSATHLWSHPQEG